MLHGAGAQRIEPHVDGVVLLAEARVVADRLGLGEAGQADLALALQPAEAILDRRRRRQIDAGAARLPLLEDQRLFDLQARDCR